MVQIPTEDLQRGGSPDAWDDGWPSPIFVVEPGCAVHRAINMARTELRDGRSADAKALAQKIVDAQQAEIATMKQMLGAS